MIRRILSISNKIAVKFFWKYGTVEPGVSTLQYLFVKINYSDLCLLSCVKVISTEMKRLKIKNTALVEH